MSKKNQTEYACTACGATTQTWSGKCYSCGEWNTMQEQVQLLAVTGAAGRSVPGKKLASQSVALAISHDSKRLKTGINEVDNVLGGGFVAGSVNLIAGQPGIGKSTLLLQLAYELSKSYRVLYVSGEESAHQIGTRASRLGVKGDSLQISTSSVADDIAQSISGGDYDFVVVDSVQTIACNGVTSAAGSVSQITNSTAILTSAAKHSDTALVIVGHVTKEGSIAGPKVLEHLVDVVLQLEGDRYGGFKLLRVIKNRYGSTNESGIFEMVDSGLRPVENPSQTLLAERQITDGSIVLATMEGSRPILVEVQALVNKTSYGYPKRAASGIDLNRMNLLIAMLERRTKLNLADKDIYLNIVGGIKLSEHAADLAVCMAIASAAKGMQITQNAVVFGELGLSGEVRHVPFIERRIAEARKLGFDTIIGPVSKGVRKKSYVSVSDIRSALNSFLGA